MLATNQEEKGGVTTLFGEMSWDELEGALEQEIPAPEFKILKPICDGRLCSPGKELMSLRHTWEWIGRMTNSESSLRTIEAAVLVMAATTVTEEDCDADEIISPDGFVGFGYNFGELFSILGSVLSPKLLETLKGQFLRCINGHHRVRAPDAKARLQQFTEVKQSYSDYLNFRNDDGYFEAALYCCMAAAGKSGELLRPQTTRDAVEVCILLHDSHTIARHFAEEDISNIHRITGDPERSLIQAFRRSAYLYTRIRHDASVAPPLKNAICGYINSFHSFNYSCERYGYGSVYSKSIVNSIKSGDSIAYLKGIHHIKPDFKQSFEDMLEEYRSSFHPAS